jgi:hypothetical protein
VEINTFLLPKDIRSVRQLCLASGRMPSFVAVCYVKETGFHPDPTKSAFQYESCGLKSASICINGSQNHIPAVIPGQGLTLQFIQFLRAMGLNNDDENDSVFTLKSINNGYNVQLFNLTSDCSRMSEPSVEKTDPTMLTYNAEFETELAENFVGITYMVYPNTTIQLGNELIKNYVV